MFVLIYTDRTSASGWCVRKKTDGTVVGVWVGWDEQYVRDTTSAGIIRRIRRWIDDPYRRNIHEP